MQSFPGETEGEGERNEEPEEAILIDEPPPNDQSIGYCESKKTSHTAHWTRYFASKVPALSEEKSSN